MTASTVLPTTPVTDSPHRGILAFASLFSLAAACAEPAKAPQSQPAAGVSATSAATWPLLPRRRLVTLDSARPIPGRAFSVRIFHYAAQQGNWPYGTGISVWRDGASTPAWLYFVDGDFPPHTLVWRDLSGDSVPDLFFLAGEENEFRTTALVWRQSDEATSDSLLVPIYSDSTSYAMLADLDGDALPELVASGDGDEDPENCTGVVVPAPISKAIQAEYTRVAAPYGAANFTYGMSGTEASTMHLFHPVKIFTLRNGVQTEVTRRLDAHIRWRINVLEQLRPSVSPECQSTIDDLLGYMALKPTSP